MPSLFDLNQEPLCPSVLGRMAGFFALLWLSIWTFGLFCFLAVGVSAAVHMGIEMLLPSVSLPLYINGPVYGAAASYSGSIFRLLRTSIMLFIIAVLIYIPNYSYYQHLLSLGYLLCGLRC